jgi:hypothetical protein
MSRVHLHFIRERDQGSSVIYRVDSSDFNVNQIEEPIARITIDPEGRSYGFEPLGELLNARVVPPYVYDLPESESDEMLRVRYKGFGYGGWTARMASVVRRLLADEDFPAEIYGVG